MDKKKNEAKLEIHKFDEKKLLAASYGHMVKLLSIKRANVDRKLSIV